ncbi:DUF1772 domain-containing protein [Idiomarina sp. ST10R2A5]|uniref:DUF1772 domain-containing protein n=1 Tax=Idiomarina sp. ST10R2A5 TaxID=3418368 RepID=UPI003EC6CEB9
MYIFEIIAVLSCALFAGAAIYITFAEHPARLECGTELAATVFGPSYRRAAVMQASLALVAAISGLIVALSGDSLLWYIGAVLIFSVVPFTFIVIMPTNKQLLSPEGSLSVTETHRLLVKWGRLHAVRSSLSLVAAILYVYALSG